MEEEETILDIINKKKKVNSYDSKFKGNETIAQSLKKNKNKPSPHLLSNNYTSGEKTKGNYNLTNDDYMTGYENPETEDLNELRAVRQSWQDHLGIGAVRTVAKAATEIAKLPGVIGGIGIMAADGLTGGNLVAENEGFETAFNNQWIKYFDGLNEDVKEALPVYVKESVKNGDFFEKIGSSATWASEGADGAGFMLGMLAPGAIFKFAGGANALFGASIKAAKLAKYGEGIEAGRKALMEAGITINRIDQFMIPAFNTLSEAGAESKGVWDGMESRKGDAHKEYMSKLKHDDPRYQKAISLRHEEIDQLRRSGEISLEESQELYKTAHITAAETMFEKDFKEQKALAAQNSFFKNVVVLAGPNYIQAKLLFGKTPSKVLLDKIGGLGEKSIKNTVKQGIKNFAEGFLSEGAEEVAQTAIENRNKEQGLKFKLGNDRGDDYNPLTFGDDFIKTLGTTEGQMAGFLGGIMGAPMSAYGGYKQDVEDRVTTERLREKINGASTAYADIKNTNIYEQEEYTNPETGEVGFRDREVDGKKVFIPENVAKVKNALNLIEKDSNEYDNAVEDGDIEKIEQFRNKGEFNVIANFIGEDEVTLDALHEHLKVAFPTETSKDISDEQVKVNKTNLERIDKIMSKAKSIQKDFVSFKDMSASILRINHPDITKDSTKEEKKAANEHLEDFLNRVGNTFLSERAEEYEAKQVLNKLEKQRLDLENNSTPVEIDNPNYVEGKSSELDKKTTTRTNNPRLELVNSLIDKVKEQLKGYEENTNSNIWNNELLNKQFAKEVELRKQIKEDNSPEQVAKNDAELAAIAKAKTEEELEQVYIKEGEIGIINDIKKRISEDSSLENLQNVLEIVKNSNFTNFVANNLVKSIEDAIQKITDDRSQFEEIVFEIAEKYSVKNKQLVDKLTEIENRISKLIESKKTLKKSLSEATGKSKNKLLRKLVKETQSEIDKVDSEIKILESEKTKLLQDLESIDKNLDYLYNRLEQINKVGFTSIDDIIKYLDKNKNRFGEHRFDIARLSTQQFYTNQNIENVENLIDYLEDYKVVLEQTIKDYLAADEEHSQDLYYLQRELEDSIDELAKLKKELPQEKAKLLRLDKSLNDKLAKQSLDKEIEFWNKLQKYKESKKPNPVIQQKAEAKKAEIIKAEEVANAEEIAIATQEDNDFNDTTGYSDLNGTEGSNITDELRPKDSENNTSEELKNIDNEEVLTGKGAQVISTNMKTGELFSFVSEDYLNYERNPINKAGKEVGFEINTNPGVNKNLNIALKMLEDKDFSNPAFLISYLPINVIFEKGIKAPMETRRANGKLDSKKDKDGKDQFYINPATEILRSQIINHLVNGGSISNIKTTIQDQYKGLLKVDDNRLANNNILELDGVPNLKYVRDNLYVVDSFGNLMNIQSGKTKTFINDKVKKNAAGEIYLEIPQANGKPFSLKLNIKKISESEAVLLYEIYKEIITNEKSLDTTVSEVNDNLRESILKSFEAELNIIGGNKNDIKLQEIVDLLIYQSDNVKSRMQVEKNDKGETILLFGENEANINNIEESQNAIINFLVDSKRHQIKINPKFATDNTKTNLKSNSADYLKYLIDNDILTTNAVVNEPTFQGYANIYLNTGVTVTNQVKSTQKVAEVSPEIADVEKRRKADIEKYDERDARSLEAITPNNPNHKVFKVGMKTTPGMNIRIEKTDTDNWNGEGDGYTVITAVKESAEFGEDGIMTKSAKVERAVFNTKEEADAAVQATFERAKNLAGKAQEKANAKYNAELAALNEPKVSESGAEVKTDNTGFDEMFNTSEMGNDVLDILKEFETETKVENQSDIEAKKTIQEISRENISFFVSGGVGVGHQSYPANKATSDYDIRSTLVKLDGFRYVEHSDGTISFHIPYNGLDVRGGSHLGIAIKGLKLEQIDSKSIKQVIDKLGDALSKISKNVTGDERFNEIKKIGNQIINTELANLKNKSENTRNSQENFLSLSEIKGTVENTQLKETQAEVFNEVINVPSATEMRLLNKATDVFKNNPSELTDIQRQRLEEAAVKYPETYKKLCQ